MARTSGRIFVIRPQQKDKESWISHLLSKDAIYNILESYHQNCQIYLSFLQFWSVSQLASEQVSNQIRVQLSYIFHPLSQNATYQISTKFQSPSINITRFIQLST